MIGMKAANLQVLNTPKPLPVSKESVASSTKMLFTEPCPGQVVISQYTDETASENTHSAYSKRGRKLAAFLTLRMGSRENGIDTVSTRRSFRSKYAE